MYTTVQFATNRAVPPFLVPDASLVVEANGTTPGGVTAAEPGRRWRRPRRRGWIRAVLARARIVHFQKVQPGRDYGTTLEILDGLQVGDYVVVNPGDAVKEGAIVQMADSGVQFQATRGSSK